MKSIDHFVYCVPNLEESIQHFKKLYGIEATYGGRHLNQGTHNALFNVGNDCYFELIAVDPENKNIQAPRWMGIDLIKEPTLTRWGIKTNQMSEDLKVLKNINPKLASSKTGMRQKTDGSILNWELSIPLAAPAIEPIPFLIDWKKSIHPTSDLPQESELLKFTIFHPEPIQLKRMLKSLDILVEVKQAKALALQAEIQFPNGKVILN